MNVAPRRVILLGTENADGTVSGTSGNPNIGPWVDCTGFGKLAIFTNVVGHSTAGVLAIEEADWGAVTNPYSNTVFLSTSVDLTTLTSAITVNRLTGSFSYVRANLTTTPSSNGKVFVSMKMME